MWNGFFDLKEINDLEVLKQMYRDALEVSISSRVDILRSFKRERYTEITSEDYIENHITLKTHNIVIDRNQHRGGYTTEWDYFGEIGSCTYNSPSLFLFINLDRDSFYDIVDKYNLPKRLI